MGRSDFLWLTYFQQLVECTSCDSRKKRFIQTALSQMWKMSGVLWWSRTLFLRNPQGRINRIETIYKFKVTKFTLWLKHRFQRKTLFFKMIMPQSIQLELLKNDIEDHCNEIEHLVWPAQIPDLNIIEHLWSVLKIQLRQKFQLPSSLKELKDILTVSLETIHKLYVSIPWIIDAVIAARGGQTSY